MYLVRICTIYGIIKIPTHMNSYELICVHMSSYVANVGITMFLDFKCRFICDIIS